MTNLENTYEEKLRKIRQVVLIWMAGSIAVIVIGIWFYMVPAIYEGNVVVITGILMIVFIVLVYYFARRSLRRNYFYQYS